MRRPPQPPSPARFNRRLLIAMAGSLAGFGLLAAQAWNLQVASYIKRFCQTVFKACAIKCSTHTDDVVFR